MKPHFKCPYAHIRSDIPILDRMSESEQYSLRGGFTASPVGPMPGHGSRGVTISICNLH